MGWISEQAVIPANLHKHCSANLSPELSKLVIL